MNLDEYDYALFNGQDFTNIIGESLQDKLSDRGIANYDKHFITYVSILISSCIKEHTSLNIYKDYDIALPNDYSLYLGLSRRKNENGEYSVTYRVDLTEEQIEAIKLACVYQADYIIDNGSTERMSAIGMVNRSNKYDKYDLKEFEICSLSYSILSTAGLLYQGLGGGVYARIK